MTTTLEPAADSRPPTEAGDFHTRGIPDGDSENRAGGPAGAAPTAGPAVYQAVAVPMAWVTASEINPRKHFDEAEIRSLADDIARYGLNQAVVLRDDLQFLSCGTGPTNPSLPHLVRNLEAQVAKGEAPAPSLPIVMGERRWRAVRLLGWTHVPATVREGLTDDTHLEMALSENIKREDLTPIEMAGAFVRMMRTQTQGQIGAKFGIGNSAVSNAVKLLDLPADVQGWIDQGRLTQGHGVALGKYKALPALCSRIADAAVADGAGIRDLSRIADSIMTPAERETLFPSPAVLPLAPMEDSPAAFAGPGPEPFAPSPAPGVDAPEAAHIPTDGLSDAEWEASAKPPEAAEPVVTAPEPQITESDSEITRTEAAIAAAEDEASDDRPGLYDERDGAADDDGAGNEDGGDGETAADEAGAGETQAAETPTERPGDDEPAKTFSRPDPSPATPVQVVDKRHTAQAVPSPFAPGVKPPAPPAPAKTTPAAPPAAPAPPPGMMHTFVKKDDYDQAMRIGAWPIGRALAVIADQDEQIKAAQQQATPNPALGLSISAAMKLAESNKTGEGAVMTPQETELLEQLFPKREETTPEQILAVLVTRRLRQVAAGHDLS